MSEYSDRALEIAADLLEAPPGRRAKMADTACGADAGLRAEIDRLLALGPKLHGFLEVLLPTQEELARAGADGRDGTDVRAGADAPAGAGAGLRFGRYHTVALIGEGGMGSVYEAEQDRTHRRVALKVIKPGMDSRQILARFETEREALALMEHPNIAAVIDAGVADGGRPFFVMELVRGVPLTEYCDANALPVREQLELFIPVCRAVQHAHQKGVLHRDIKPSNVLVTIADGRPLPKVIDFGIAKATRQRLGDRTALTEVRQLLGTPEYMSPEQAGAGGADVDTRTDVYALGAVLYELLTGTTPFDCGRLRGADWEEIRRLIREEEPPRPSTRLGRSTGGGAGGGAAGGGGAGTAGDAVARWRRTDAAGRLRAVRGELDWIVMKCLEKERSRRYESASELAADVERHLRNEPVHAGPPTAAYRLKKFARRNRASLAAAGAMVLLLVGGIVGTTVGMRRAVEGRHRAEALLKQVGEAEKQARQEADLVGSLNEFLLGMFRAARPDEEGGGPATKVIDLLNRAAEDLPTRFHNQPEAEIQARASLGVTYSQLGLQAPALENLRVAHAMAREHLGEESDLTLQLGAQLAHRMVDGPVADAVGAEALARRTHETALRKHGRPHVLTFSTQNTWGLTLYAKGDLESAETVLRSVVNQYRQTPSLADLNDNANGMNNLAMVMRRRGRLDDAEALQRESLAQPDPSPRRQSLRRHNLGLILAEQGKPEEAAVEFRRVLDENEGKLGATHSLIVKTANEYVKALVRAGKTGEATGFARRRLDAAAAERPRNDAVVADFAAQLGELLSADGQPEAADHFEQAITARRAAQAVWYPVPWRNWVLQAGLGRHRPFRSDAVRKQVWSVIDEMLIDQPNRTLSLDRSAWAGLRFQLFRWNGVPSAPPGKQAALVAEGGMAKLRSLDDPEEGLYVLSLEIPARDTVLRAAKWVVYSRWRQSVYVISPLDWQVEQAWQEATGAPAAESRDTLALCTTGWLADLSWPGGRDTNFGLIAETTARLPPGPYRFVVNSDDGFRLRADGRLVCADWQTHRPTRSSATAELGQAPQTLRVEFFQGDGSFTLWLRVEPLAGPAAVFAAELAGETPGALRRRTVQAALKFDEEGRHADAAAHYRLAGEIDDEIGGGPDEPVRRLRARAEALTREGRHAEAAAVYKALLRPAEGAGN